MSAAACLWLLDCASLGEGDLAGFHASLGADEMARYRRFLRPLRQRQFLAGRVLLRRAAGRLLGVPTATLLLTERPGQAPLLALADGAPAPFFSLSHSGRWVACALSADTPLGLDIEMLDSGRDVLALAAQAFGAGAAARLAALPPAARSGAFYRLWSEREALYKLGACPAPACVSLAHADLSIVLCSAQPLAAIEREYGLPSPRPG